MLGGFKVYGFTVGREDLLYLTMYLYFHGNTC